MNDPMKAKALSTHTELTFSEMTGKVDAMVSDGLIPLDLAKRVFREVGLCLDALPADQDQRLRNLATVYDQAGGRTGITIAKLITALADGLDSADQQPERH